MGSGGERGEKERKHGATLRAASLLGVGPFAELFLHGATHDRICKVGVLDAFSLVQG